jgi:hypothetical protein
MFKTTKLQVVSLACVIAASSLQPAFAQTSTSAGTITTIGTGWSMDAFGIATTAPKINPAGCAQSSFYEASSTAPGYNTYYAAVLTAYSTGSQVNVIVSNTTCAQGLPMIIGINITPNP